MGHTETLKELLKRGAQITAKDKARAGLRPPLPAACKARVRAPPARWHGPSQQEAALAAQSKKQLSGSSHRCAWLQAGPPRMSHPPAAAASRRAAGTAAAAGAERQAAASRRAARHERQGTRASGSSRALRLPLRVALPLRGFPSAPRMARSLRSARRPGAHLYRRPEDRRPLRSAQARSAQAPTAQHQTRRDAPEPGESQRSFRAGPQAGWCSLHFAAKNGHLPAVKSLVEAGTEVGGKPSRFHSFTLNPKP